MPTAPLTRVPLCTLQAGDRFRLQPDGGIIEISFQSPKMAQRPEGQLLVIPVED